MTAPRRRQTRKVYAYITSGRRLLVFRHVDEPQAGLQVPGGTVEAGESFEAALVREIREEAGLEGLELLGPAGEDRRLLSAPGGVEVQERRFFHLRSVGRLPDRWRHVEEHASDGSGPLLFEFFWLPFEPPPELVGNLGVFLFRIKR